MNSIGLNKNLYDVCVTKEVIDKSQFAVNCHVDDL